MRILGIETSCDETGIAVYDDNVGLLGHQLYSQVDLHTEYGGVVPELASRDHVRKTIPLIDQTLAQCDTQPGQLDGIAYTSGPGLMGALMVGAVTGRSLAYAWGIPALGVHHMEAHLLAPMLEKEQPEFPFVALLVSGGHSQLVRVDGIGRYELIGESLDDAAGEAFDKTAKLLGLHYPGGPEIARLARGGSANRYQFPRPMTDRPGLDMSFSGLKTFAANTIARAAGNEELPDQQTCADIAWAFQEAVVDTLVIKCERALKQTDTKTLVIAGGVSANQRLRDKLKQRLSPQSKQVFYASHEFCTDNGAMIAYAGMLRLRAGLSDSLSLDIKARWPLSQLTAI